MAPLTQHQSATLTKMLLLGDSGSGKTGALASLVSAGYKLRILDFDNGADILYQVVMRDCPDKAENVDVITLRDPKKASPLGPIISGTPQAFTKALALLDRWKYESTDLGPPAAFGPDTIVVIDSLSFMSDAAMDWAEPLVPRSRDGKHDRRAVYGMAQDAIEGVLGLLTNSAFATNVIVTAHIRYIDQPDGTKKGQPQGPGAALSPIIPRYFNSTALCEGQAGGKRYIKTVSTGLLDLKNPAPFAMVPQLPIETGLSEFFKTVRAKK